MILKCRLYGRMRGRMKLWQKSLYSIIVMIVFFITGMLDIVCYAANEKNAPKESELYAKSAVLMDGDSGRILYAKNGNNAMANASTTKILTCILALEYSQMDAVLTASQRAAAAPKVHLGMKAGQKFYMKDMLHALMLESYNDCAVVIAEHIAGSVEDFAVLMNTKAAQIGCKDTYFITPNGLDGTDKNGFHHTTAEDLALMMRYCTMISEKQIEFREITATRSYTFSEIDGDRTYTVTNKNAFLDMMQGAFSGKTGFTGNAGYCYVGALEQNEKTYIVALLACGWPNNRSYKWSDCKKLMKYGLEQFETIQLDEIEIGEEKLGEILVKNGQSNRIGEKVFVKPEIELMKGFDKILSSKEEEIQITYEMKKEWEAPLKEKTEIGNIFVSIGDEILREYVILSSETVESIDFQWCMQMVMKYFFIGCSIF